MSADLLSPTLPVTSPPASGRSQSTWNPVEVLPNVGPEEFKAFADIATTAGKDDEARWASDYATACIDIMKEDDESLFKWNNAYQVAIAAAQEAQMDGQTELSEVEAQFNLQAQHVAVKAYRAVYGAEDGEQSPLLDSLAGRSLLSRLAGEGQKEEGKEGEKEEMPVAEAGPDFFSVGVNGKTFRTKDGLVIHCAASPLLAGRISRSAEAITASAAPFLASSPPVAAVCFRGCGFVCAAAAPLTPEPITGGCADAARAVVSAFLGSDRAAEGFAAHWGRDGRCYLIPGGAAPRPEVVEDSSVAAVEVATGAGVGVAGVLHNHGVRVRDMCSILSYPPLSDSQSPARGIVRSELAARTVKRVVQGALRRAADVGAWGERDQMTWATHVFARALSKEGWQDRVGTLMATRAKGLPDAFQEPLRDRSLFMRRLCEMLGTATQKGKVIGFVPVLSGRVGDRRSRWREEKALRARTAALRKLEPQSLRFAGCLQMLSMALRVDEGGQSEGKEVAEESIKLLRDLKVDPSILAGALHAEGLWEVSQDKEETAIRYLSECSKLRHEVAAQPSASLADRGACIAPAHMWAQAAFVVDPSEPLHPSLLPLLNRSLDYWEQDGVRVRFGADNVLGVLLLQHVSRSAGLSGDPAAAEPSARRAAERMRAEFGLKSEKTVVAVSELAYILLELERTEEAAEQFMLVVEAQKRLHGAQHPDTAAALNNLAIVDYRRGRALAGHTSDDRVVLRPRLPAEAVKALTRAKETLSEVVALPSSVFEEFEDGRGGTVLVDAMANLGAVHMMFYDFRKAEELLELSKAEARRRFGEDADVEKQEQNLRVVRHRWTFFGALHMQTLYRKFADRKRVRRIRKHMAICAAALSVYVKVRRECIAMEALAAGGAVVLVAEVCRDDWLRQVAAEAAVVSGLLVAPLVLASLEVPVEEAQARSQLEAEEATDCMDLAEAHGRLAVESAEGEGRSAIADTALDLALSREETAARDALAGAEAQGRDILAIESDEGAGRSVLDRTAQRERETMGGERGEVEGRDVIAAEEKAAREALLSEAGREAGEKGGKLLTRVVDDEEAARQELEREEKVARNADHAQSDIVVDESTSRSDLEGEESDVRKSMDALAESGASAEMVKQAARIQEGESSSREALEGEQDREAEILGVQSAECNARARAEAESKKEEPKEEAEPKEKAKEEEAKETRSLPPHNADWWQTPELADDFHKKGDKAEKWLAASLPLAEASRGQSDPASAEEKEKRAAWYKDNWWTRPEFADDFDKSGDKAEKWPAASLPSAEANKGQSDPASADEKERRSAWYRDNEEWWKKQCFADDYHKNKEGATKWLAASPPSAE
eukprot:Hpha_TRINITY_DN16057_c0_g1::TRINITY_DN16057_c0_g1_i12::g.118474::m.118474